MVPEGFSKAPKAGLSLYANLLDPSSLYDPAHGTISRAPVVFSKSTGESSQPDEGSAQKQQISAASLKFQPTRRPQLSAQKPKPKPSVQSVIAPRSHAISPKTTSANLTGVTQKPITKVTLADWTAEGDDEDVNGFFGGEKRQRGGRKKRKKNNEEPIVVVQNWDDIYDPSRPNGYEEYKNSDEKMLEMREWKEKLYAHRFVKPRNSDANDSDDSCYSASQARFARPSFSFAPPAEFDDSDPVALRPVSHPNESSGDEASARRIRISQTVKNASSPPPLLPLPIVAPSALPLDDSAKGSPSLPPLAPGGTLSPTISRAPIRYNLPSAPSEIPTSEVDLEEALQLEEIGEGDHGSRRGLRSLRPGQQGFAQRLMSKYGWTKGSGLGATGAGIINPLRVQIEKQKKKPDSEGGGFAGPGGRGKIISGKREGGIETTGKFGPMTEVVVLYGMVDGMDLDAEMEGVGDGGIMQEIGEECGEKYGRVERVFIDRSKTSEIPVFVKFTSQLSALRAVNALEGRIFNGNTIMARFFDTEKFENAGYA